MKAETVYELEMNLASSGKALQTVFFFFSHVDVSSVSDKAVMDMAAVSASDRKSGQGCG